jgi:hypothetical protein
MSITAAYTATAARCVRTPSNAMTRSRDLIPRYNVFYRSTTRVCRRFGLSAMLDMKSTGC